MKHILINSKLDIDQNELITNALEDNNTVFLKQGSLDGACGPYCLFMSLIIFGIIDRNQAMSFWKVKRSTRFGNLIKQFEKHSSLFSEGTDLYDLESLLNSFSSELVTNVLNSKGKKVLNFLIDELNLNKTVILGINGNGLNHWLLAIGYEKDSESDISKILCIDPSAERLETYYNATISVAKPLNKGRYPYKWLDYGTENENIQFEHCISIGLK